MPGFDQTGPRGEGPRTGGGRGNCAPDGSVTPNPQPVYGVGRGGYPRGGGRGRCFGGGRGFGRGMANRGWPVAPANTERNDVEELTREVAALRKELADLKGTPEEQA